MKTCTKCGIEKPLDDFYLKTKSKKRADGSVKKTLRPQSACKSCVREKLDALPKRTRTFCTRNDKRRPCSCPKCAAIRKQKEAGARIRYRKSDAYIKRLLGLGPSVPKELVDLKRQSILLKRLGRKVKEAINPTKEKP